MKKKQKLTEKENFTQICQQISLCMAVILGALLFMGPVEIANKLLTEDFTKSLVYSSVIFLIELVLHIAAVNYLRLLFKRMSETGRPFSSDTAGKIKAVSLSLFLGGAAYLIVLAVLCLIEPKGTVGAMTGADAGTGIGYLFIGGIIYSLGYIFSYGAKLQQESDDTI